MAYAVGPPSHVLFNIKYPYIVVQIISVLVQVIGANTTDILPWDKGEEIGTAVPIVRTSFLMTSFLMSLLLSYRINQVCKGSIFDIVMGSQFRFSPQVYARWQAARQSLAGVGNGTTSIFMTMSAWLQDQPEKRQLLDDIRRYCIIYPYSILQVVRGERSRFQIPRTRLQPYKCLTVQTCALHMSDCANLCR